MWNLQMYMWECYGFFCMKENSLAFLKVFGFYLCIMCIFDLWHPNGHQYLFELWTGRQKSKYILEVLFLIQVKEPGRKKIRHWDAFILVLCRIYIPISKYIFLGPDPHSIVLKERQLIWINFIHIYMMSDYVLAWNKPMVTQG